MAAPPVGAAGAAGAAHSTQQLHRQPGPQMWQSSAAAPLASQRPTSQQSRAPRCVLTAGLLAQCSFCTVLLQTH